MIMEVKIFSPHRGEDEKAFAKRINAFLEGIKRESIIQIDARTCGCPDHNLVVFFWLQNEKGE